MTITTWSPGAKAEQARQEVQTLFLSQPQVQQGHFKGPVPQEFQGLGTIAGFDGPMSKHLKRHADGASEACVVVNHEDVHGLRLSFLGIAAIVHFARLIVQSAMPKGCAAQQDILHKFCPVSQLRLLARLRHAGCYRESADTVPLRADINKHTTSRPARPRTTPVK